ncbi:DUF6036 family nucleotidyltransferase [uncultured Methanolobus sp.]|uniref:DUF6036 family nucleotidyltransferase n=1 Tax=uncultured Methanolobus sp. TaxID=218300 RepID=UPI00374791B8
MIERSHELFQLKNIAVYMISPEDIFVFKSITTRERDREDMYTLFSKALNFDLIKKRSYGKMRIKRPILHGLHISSPVLKNSLIHTIFTIRFSMNYRTLLTMIC